MDVDRHARALVHGEPVWKEGAAAVFARDELRVVCRRLVRDSDPPRNVCDLCVGRRTLSLFYGMFGGWIAYVVATVCVVAAVLIGGAFVAWRRSAQAAVKDPVPARDAVETDKV